MNHRCAPLLAALALFSLISGCQVNPATRKSNLSLVSPKEELQIGAESEPEFLKQYGGDIPSPAVLAYVSDLGKRLAAVSELPDQPWAFHVVDSSVINAFSLPGGKIFMSRGLLAKLKNEAELAGVLGHEIGHVTARHVAQQMTQTMLIQGAAEAIGAVAEAKDSQMLRILGVGAQAGGSVYLLKFSRDDETQADTLGVRYMAKLGYNPMGQVEVMQILQRESGGGQLEILSTHPLPASRITYLKDFIPKNYPDYKDPAKYRFEPDAFKTYVLDPLSRLPPPRNTGQ